MGLREVVELFGVLVALGGVVTGFVAAVGTANDSAQPAVSITLGDDGRSASGTIKVSDLSSSDRLTVYVDGLVLRNGHYQPTNLYQGFVGPNGDGEATSQPHVTFAPGTYDAIGVRAFTKKKPINCGAVPKGAKGSGNGTGCVIVTLPRHPDLPDLSASWGSSNPSASVLKLSASVADAAPGVAASRMALLVWGVRHGKRSSLYRALMTVPPSGAVKRDLDLPIPSGMGRVCAEALMVDPAASLPSPACPLARQPGAAAVELRVPRP